MHCKESPTQNEYRGLCGIDEIDYICKVIPAIMNQDNVGVQRRICSQQIFEKNDIHL